MEYSDITLTFWKIIVQYIMFIIVSDVQYISLYTKTYQPLHFEILKIFSGEARSVLSVLWFHRVYRMPGIAPLINCVILRAERYLLLTYGYVVKRLKSSMKKFYWRYGDLIKQCKVSVSRTLKESLKHDQIQWHPHPFDHTLRQFTTLPLVPKLTLTTELLFQPNIIFGKKEVYF